MRYSAMCTVCRYAMMQKVAALVGRKFLRSMSDFKPGDIYKSTLDYCVIFRAVILSVCQSALSQPG